MPAIVYLLLRASVQKRRRTNAESNIIANKQNREYGRVFSILLTQKVPLCAKSLCDILICKVLLTIFESFASLTKESLPLNDSFENDPFLVETYISGQSLVSRHSSPRVQKEQIGGWKLNTMVVRRWEEILKLETGYKEKRSQGTP